MYSIENQSELDAFVRKHGCLLEDPGCTLIHQLEAIGEVLDAGDTCTQWMIYLISRNSGKIHMHTFDIHIGEQYV